MRRCHLNPHARRSVQLLNGPSQYSCRFNTRAEDLVTMVRGFDTVHRPTRQVHQRAGAIQVTYPITKRAGIPRNVEPAIFSRGLMTGNDDYFTADTRKVTRQILTQESCASRYHNS